MNSAYNRYTSLLGKLIGYGFIIAIIYLMLATLVVFGALVQINRHVVLDVPWLLAVERHLYLNGAWNVWQTQVDCVDFDEVLIYKPKLGACEFENIEFQTTLNFDEFGRSSGHTTTGNNAIAVVGDSFAMGWGVKDNETFSAVLEARLEQPVYNLGVSSYSTYRELSRLKQTDVARAASTLVIQYTANDLAENRQLRSGSRDRSVTTFTEITGGNTRSEKQTLPYLLSGLEYSLRYPIDLLPGRNVESSQFYDFSDHYEPLVNVLTEFEDFLQNKRIIVIYVNSWGRTFANFPVGKDHSFENLTFIELELSSSDFFLLDPHLNARGHRQIAEQLADVLSMPGS